MKIKTLFAVAAVLLGVVGTEAFGQCGPNGCAGGQCGASVQPSWQPVRPTARQDPYPSLVVTEFGALGHAERTIGSGVIVAADGRKATVLTCAHGYKTLMQVFVVVQGGKRYEANIVGVDLVQDVMVLEIVDPGIAPHPLAQSEPAIGERVYACGFAGGSLAGFTGSWGVLTKWLIPEFRGDPTFVETTCLSRNGCSGGPILNSRGQVIGVITGGGEQRQTTGPCLPRVRRVLRFLLPPYPNRPAVVAGPLVPVVIPSKPAAPVPDAQMPLTPTPDPISQPDLAALRDRIAALEEQVKTLTAQPGPPGPAGPQGMTGKDGKAGAAGRDGNNGRDAAIDVNQIAAAIVKTLPPIHVQVIKDGRVIETVDVPLGGTLPLRLVPFVSTGAK